MVKVANFTFNISTSKSSETVSKFTRLEKCLFLLILIVTIICITLISVLTVRHVRERKVCSTKVCVKAAAEILDQIDERISPCDDFYAFACGGLDNEYTEIPEDRSNMWTASLFQVKINSKLKVLLEKIDNNQNETYLTKMKTLYNLCMDKDAQEALGSEPLHSVLNQFGGWPVLMGSQWNEQGFNVINTLINMRKFGYQHDLFTKITVAPHIFLQTYNVLYVGEAILALDERSYYEKGSDDSILREYYRFMVRACVHLGAEESFAEEEMKKALDFEITLAMMTTPRSKILSIYNPMSIHQLQSLSPSFNWTSYFNGIFDPFAIVNEDSFTIVYVPDYIKKLDNLLQSTDPRVLANYILWRVVLSSSVLLDEKWALMGREFYEHIDGRKSLKPRHSFCLETVKKYFTLAASGLYVQTSLDRKSLALMSSMVDYIKQSLVDMITSADWMDPITTEAALNKTRVMKLHIGYPMELENFTRINEFYSEIPLNQNNTWFETILFLRRWKKDNEYLKIVIKNEKGSWIDYANVVDVNAYYRHQENSIQFPLSIVEATGLNHEKPMYLNFGSIGWIIGHEISHGFDTIGRRFDAQGQYENWWTEETSQRYETKAKCFAEQYNQFELNETGDQIDGNRTLSENIADNGGLKEAYKAYKKYVKDNGAEPYLVGLDYNPDQLFFIKSAYFYCGKWRTPSLSYMIKTDEHSPGIFRIIGTMSNMVEFSEAFGCNSGKRMNPINKCTLW